MLPSEAERPAEAGRPLEAEIPRATEVGAPAEAKHLRRDRAPEEADLGRAPQHRQGPQQKQGALAKAERPSRDREHC